MYTFFRRVSDMNGVTLVFEDKYENAASITYDNTNGFQINDSLDFNDGISMSGSVATGLDVSGTFTTGINFSGTLTTAIAIGACTTGVSASAAALLTGIDFSTATGMIQNIILGGNGRISTSTAAGATLNIDATTSQYGEGIKVRYNISDWADTYTISDGTGIYVRMETNEANGSGSIYGIQSWGVTNNVNLKYLWGGFSYAYIKGTSAKTLTGVYAFQPEISFDAGSSANTITEACVVRAKVTGGVMADYTHLHGYKLIVGDMDGGSRTYGNAFWVCDDGDMGGTCKFTTGVNINIGCTTGIALNFTGNTAASKALSTAGFTLSNGNLTDGIGAVEADLTLTGTVAGAVSALSGWVNMGTVTTGSNIVAAQTNGLWSDSGGVLDGAVLIFGMRMQCLCQTNGGVSGTTFFPFSIVNNTNITTALIQCNAASSDLGLISDVGSDTSTLVPLYKDGSGVKYVKIYAHS